MTTQGALRRLALLSSRGAKPGTGNAFPPPRHLSNAPSQALGIDKKGSDQPAHPPSPEPEQSITEQAAYPDIPTKYPPGQWGAAFSPSWAWHYHRRGRSLLEKDDVRERLEAMAGDENKRFFILTPWDMTPRGLDYRRFITRTHMLQGRPDVYSHLDVEKHCQTLLPIIKDVIAQECDFRFRFHSERHKIDAMSLPTFYTKKLVGSILQTVSSYCGLTHPHLVHAQFDTDVRVEAFWKVGGFQGGSVWQKERKMQARGEAAFQVRTELPLPEFLPADDEVCKNGEYPDCPYEPNTMRIKYESCRPLSVSGHWVGDPCEFTHLSCLVPNERYQHLAARHGDRADILDEAWTQCGLMSSFTSCVAQAHNQGFNMYMDVTYPFTSQSLVCLDNQIQFFMYQLNTFHLWNEREVNPRNNVLWVGKKETLFDAVEGGKVRGLNENVIKQLLECLLLAPAQRDCELRPHLSQESSPRNKRQYFNNLGEPVFDVPKIGRFQYPRNAVYF